MTGEGFEFAEGFGFDGFGFGVVVEDGFEFLLLAIEGAEGLGVVEGEAAFLDAGGALKRSGLAGGRVGDGGEAELVAVDFGDFGHEVEGVDGLFGRIVEEPGDVEEAAFVADIGFVAVKGKAPDAESLAAFPLN